MKVGRAMRIAGRAVMLSALLPALSPLSAAAQTTLTVTIDQAAEQADPTNAASVNFTVIFSGVVADFATGDVAVSGTAGAITAAVTGSGTTYNVAVSGMVRDGTVIAGIPAGVASDAAGNLNAASTSTDNTVTYDVTGPTATIDQAEGQPDPTGACPIGFTVVFSEPVADFATGEVALSGTAGATTAAVTGSGAVYNVAVSGMTGDGTVVAGIPAGVATDAAGNLNTASASTDNTVTFVAGVANLTVTNTSDSGACSFRQAILDANARPGLDTIRFDIPGPGPHTIRPASALPTVVDPVVIDGATQPRPARPPLIELTGANFPLAGAPAGLTITAGDSTVRGLVVNRFVPGILLLGAANNVIEGNFLGTDVTGTLVQGGSPGARIANSPGNTIGGTAPGARNVISGGGGSEGITLEGPDAAANTVLGNFIGTDVTGTVALGGATGVRIAGALQNVIGPGNLISGNGTGVTILGADAAVNTVLGNFIGTDVTGTVALGGRPACRSTGHRTTGSASPGWAT